MSTPRERSLEDTILHLRRDLADKSKPIDMVLFCPACGVQHIDAAKVSEIDFDSMPDAPNLGMVPPEELPERYQALKDWESANWTNPPHRSHLCHGCGHIWRPADVPTNGVQAIKTRGEADSAPLPAVPPARPATSHQAVAADYQELVRALRAVEALFGHLAKDSTQKDWLDKVHALIGKADSASLPAVQLDVAGMPKIEMTLIERKAIEVLNSLKAAADGGMLKLPEGVQMNIDVLLMTASQRRVGVA